MDIDQTKPENIPSIYYLGTRFTPLDLARTVALLAERPPAAPYCYVVTPNAQHVVYAAHGDQRFHHPIEHAWLAPNDSRVIARLARLLRGIDLPPCPGSDLTALLFAKVIDHHDRIAIIGGDDALAENLRARFRLNALTQHQPPFGFINDPAAVDAAIAFAVNARARFLFIACGAPQSEQLAAQILDRGATGIALCIGASLLFLTGQIKRAPKIWRVLGLESIYRLAQEPKRLARRFVTGQLPVLWLAMKDAAGIRHAVLRTKK